MKALGIFSHSKTIALSDQMKGNVQDLTYKMSKEIIPQPKGDTLSSKYAKNKLKALYLKTHSSFFTVNAAEKQASIVVKENQNHINKISGEFDLENKTLTMFKKSSFLSWKKVIKEIEQVVGGLQSNYYDSNIVEKRIGAIIQLSEKFIDRLIKKTSNKKIIEV